MKKYSCDCERDFRDNIIARYVPLPVTSSFGALSLHHFFPSPYLSRTLYEFATYEFKINVNNEIGGLHRSNNMKKKKNGVDQFSTAAVFPLISNVK